MPDDADLGAGGMLTELKTATRSAPHSQVHITHQLPAWVGHAAEQRHARDHMSRGRGAVHPNDTGRNVAN